MPPPGRVAALWRRRSWSWLSAGRYLAWASRLTVCSGTRRAWDIFRRMVPPAFAEAAERGVVGKVLESVHIAWIGTLIGATLSFRWLS
ncbi:MAG: hypothetical protein Ct9H300mP31_11020 [Acidimicrobiaceae bacterium]|nr:MAG: hypothetical protein Ct9H300mP31_11020 [Acidimicrobiaceae bacterium]